MRRRHPARRHDQPPVSRGRDRLDGALDFAGVADVGRTHLDLDRSSHGLDHGEICYPLGGSGIAKDRSTLHAWRDLLQEFEQFRSEGVFERQETSNVAARVS